MGGASDAKPSPRANPPDGWFQTALAAGICLFTLVVVNRPMLTPQSRLAIFAMLGLVICFTTRPSLTRFRDAPWDRWLGRLLAGLSALACGYVVVQSEPAFSAWWPGGASLGDRAGLEGSVDIAVGAIGLLLVLEATRRAIGWALPSLALVFVAYAFWGPRLPDFLFPHRGYDLERIVSQTFLQSQGVFGTALYVMFTYVFMFVLFGALLKQTGATQYIIDFAQRIFAGSPGAPAKVSVLSSGLMGSLSGSAVANTATTGTFTIPMMRSSGFRAEVAAGIEAAASSGGALVPPVMGAGAYMMLEIVDPPVTFVQIMRAAIVPALLYYLSLILIVHFFSRRLGLRPDEAVRREAVPWFRFAGLVFVGAFGVLIGGLIYGYSIFRAVSLALVAIVAISAVDSTTRLTLNKLLGAMRQAARDVVPLVAAAACVGVVLGIVVLTGIGSKLPATILSVAQDSLLVALVLIMVSSIILGMGLPSAVCYLLMATLIGPVLGDLGVVPLAAHFFIFYFGMMSMVTPPVALAAYTAGTIAGAGILQTAVAAFRFALVGFTLPYMFVYRPQLLMMNAQGEPASVGAVLYASAIGVFGVIGLAASIAGYLLGRLNTLQRAGAGLAALLLLMPGRWLVAGVPLVDSAGIALLALVALWSRLRPAAAPPMPPPPTPAASAA